jgi:lipopolysaccharide transport system ATP-binding protein
MKKQVAIKVAGISKQYHKKGPGLWSSLIKNIYPINKLISFYNKHKNLQSPESDECFWALKDLTFDVIKGERIGIIGRNGAGKSTLLKILSRLTYPTEGEVRIRGRVTSLLEVGTGFNMSLNGRDNIYLNASLHGLDKSEIDAIFNDVVEFSGVGEFLDMPVKHYSSGMYMRLAFSVAAHLDPDILLMDEVLAVGDLSFQQKCLQRVENLASQGRTIIFVSHSMGDIARFCDQVVWIDRGELRFKGNTVEGIALYQQEVYPLQLGNLSDFAGRPGSGLLRYCKLSMYNKDGVLCESLQTGEPAVFKLAYKITNKIRKKPFDVFAFIAFENDKRQRLFSLPSEVLNLDLTDIEEFDHLVCSVKRLPLIPGVYYLTISILIDRQLSDKVIDAAKIVVVEGDFYGTGRLPIKSFGEMCVDFNWSLGKIK